MQKIDISTNLIEGKIEINNSLEDVNNNENFTDESKPDTNIKKVLKYLVTDSNGNTTVKTRNITIVKDKPPQIFGADDITIKKGESFDYSEGVYVKDDNDIQVDTSINGFVDTNTVGKYELEYIAKDSKGNTSKKNQICICRKIEKNVEKMNFMIISIVLYIKVHFLFFYKMIKKQIITQIVMKIHISKMVYYIFKEI